jgi:DNA-directed RNA polymerase
MISNASKAVVFLSIGLVVSVLGCGVLAYMWIDRSVSFAYLSASHDTTVSALKKVTSLLENEWLGMSEQDLLLKLQAEADRRVDEEVVIERDSEEGVIWFDEIKFELEAGSVRRVSI